MVALGLGFMVVMGNTGWFQVSAVSGTLGRIMGQRLAQGHGKYDGWRSKQ